MRYGLSGRLVAFTWVPLVLVVAGCFGEIDAPPLPDEDRVPTIVGRIDGWAEPNVSYRLDTGDVVVVDGPDGATLLNGSVWMRDFDHPAGLILAGEDAAGRFYAATRFPEGDGCYLIQGLGYIDPNRVHFSSGLVLPFLKDDIVIDNTRGHYPESWLLSHDWVCLDQEGRVTSIHQLPLGA